MINNLSAIESHGGEADDYIIDAINECSGKCVVSSIDKDVLYYSPNIPFYDYRSYNDVLGEFKCISEKESRFAKATQIITGDATDGIPGAYGIGKTYCTKNMNIDMTNYQFIKEIFKAYLKSTKNNPIEAKKQIRLYYKVLKLYTIKELNNLWE
jgi:hypothetical protein